MICTWVKRARAHKVGAIRAVASHNVNTLSQSVNRLWAQFELYSYLS